MTNECLTEVELDDLIAKIQVHSEIMSELGSAEEALESKQILSCLCELKRRKDEDGW